MTIYGESAGGTSVTTLVVSPLVQQYNPPLFHRAIIQSNPLALPVVEAVEGAGTAQRFASALGCATDPIDMQCLRNVNIPTLLDAQAKAASHKNFSDLLMSGYMWAPALGSWVPDHPLNLMLAGKFPSTLSIMIGTVEEEGRLFVYEIEKSSMGSVAYEAFLAVLFRSNVLKVTLALCLLL